MHDKIIHYLNQVQAERNIEILLACETGSRAWGFPSPDSDFDVRFIYRHPRDWYLALNEKKDTIECMYENNEFDLSGWDLKDFKPAMEIKRVFIRKTAVTNNIHG